MKKKNKHGGKRKGSGRPTGSTTKEATNVMRIPISKVDAVKEICKPKF